LTPSEANHKISPESSDGFASVGTILPREKVALLPGGLFVSRHPPKKPLLSNGTGFKPLELPALKRTIIFRTLSRNAEALLPSAKAEGSHPADGPGARWEPSHLCGGWSASALRKQGSTSILRFSAGESQARVFPQPVKPVLGRMKQNRL
jgi:hypothetical protein